MPTVDNEVATSTVALLATWARRPRVEPGRGRVFLSTVRPHLRFRVPHSKIYTANCRATPGQYHRQNRAAVWRFSILPNLYGAPARPTIRLHGRFYPAPGVPGMSASTVYDTLDNWREADDLDIDGFRFGVQHEEDESVAVYVTHASPGYVVWVAEGQQRQRVGYEADKADAKGSMQQWAQKLANVRAARSFVRETGVEDYGIELPDTIADKDDESIPYSVGSRKIRRKLADYYESTDDIAEASDDELDSFAGLGPKTLEGLRDEFGGGDPEQLGPDRPFRLGDMADVEPSGLELDDPATEIPGIGDANYYNDRTVRWFWENGCPFHEVGGQYQQDALRTILGAEWFDVDAPSHVVRVFAGYMGADAYDDDGNQLGNYPEAMFGMFDWDDVAIAWSWGADSAGGNVGSEKAAGANIIEQQAALGAGEDLPFHQLDYDPEEDYGLSGLHDVVGIDKHEHDNRKRSVVYTADTSPLGEVENDEVYIPHDTVWFYSVLFGIDYTDLRVAQQYVKVVVDTTDENPDMGYEWNKNRQWVAVFDHPTAPFYGIAEGSLAVEPWDFDLDAADQFDEWAAEVAERIEQRDSEVRVPERVRRGVAPQRQLDDEVGVTTLSEDDTRPVDRAEPGADEVFEERMASIYDPTEEYEGNDDPDPMYAVVHEDGAYKYIRGFGGDEAAADAHAAEMGEEYEVQYDPGNGLAEQASGGEMATVTADGNEYEVPVSGNGYTLTEPTDDPEDGVGHGPTVHVRYEQDNGRAVMAVKGRGTNTRLFHWEDAVAGRSTRHTLHGPVNTTEVMRHLREYVNGERELPYENEYPAVEGKPEVGNYLHFHYSDGGGLHGTVTRIDEDRNEALVRVGDNPPYRYDWNTNTVTDDRGNIHGVEAVDLGAEQAEQFEDDEAANSYEAPGEDDLQDAIAARGINNIVASNLADQYDSLGAVEQAVREADDPSDIKGVGEATAQDVAAAFLGTDDTDTSTDTPFNPGNVDTIPDEVKTPDIDGGPPERVGDLWRSTSEAEINYDHKGGEDIQVRLEAVEGGYEVVHVEDGDRYVVGMFDSRGPAVDKTVSVAESVAASDPIREQVDGAADDGGDDRATFGAGAARDAAGGEVYDPSAELGEEYDDDGSDDTGADTVDPTTPDARLSEGQAVPDEVMSEAVEDINRQPGKDDQREEYIDVLAGWIEDGEMSGQTLDMEAERLAVLAFGEEHSMAPAGAVDAAESRAERRQQSPDERPAVSDDGGEDPTLTLKLGASIQTDRAEDLLNRYGSLERVATTAVDSPDSLTDVDGVGDSTADSVEQWALGYVETHNLTGDGYSSYDPEPSDYGYKNKRMENAHYWAAQLLGWMKNGPNAGIRGTYYVDVVGGKPVLVMDGDEWNESSIDAVVDGLREVDFPEPLRVTTDDTGGNHRLFISEPSDDRLTSNYHPDWQDFEPTGGDQGTPATKFTEDQLATWDTPEPEPEGSMAFARMAEQVETPGEWELAEVSTEARPYARYAPISGGGHIEVEEQLGAYDVTDEDTRVLANGVDADEAFDAVEFHVKKRANTGSADAAGAEAARTKDRLKDMGVNGMTVMHLVDDGDTVEDVRDMVESAAENGDITDLPGITDASADEVREAFDMGREVGVEQGIGLESMGGESAQTPRSNDDSDPYDPDEDTDRIGREQAEKERRAIEAARDTDPSKELSGAALEALKEQWSVYKQTLSEGREAVEEVEEYREAREEGREAAAIINDIRGAHGQEPIDFNGVDAIPSVEELAGPITQNDPGISLSFSWDAGFYDPTEDV
ncbi:head protein [Haloarcula hispanica icosahedral virus 2]|uniref:VP1 n=1 Tax=Haloarcula hispanica icosahedral virus 2 TaxID=1154689 RepID=H9AZW1_9VIRU|nr:head protein [Haloarcula hispanica icosahedral virus 2]AFD02286.1 VP1 [Haloarcula hispanica icosahedral virus 2]